MFSVFREQVKFNINLCEMEVVSAGEDLLSWHRANAQ